MFFQVIFLSDLVNCRVISLESFADFLRDLIDCASQADVPQVEEIFKLRCKYNYIACLFLIF